MGLKDQRAQRNKNERQHRELEVCRLSKPKIDEQYQDILLGNIAALSITLPSRIPTIDSCMQALGLYFRVQSPNDEDMIVDLLMN